MNYLAHAYLSFNKSEILVGNMISDYIKGNKQFDYPLSIQKGIRLHRHIDNYTDTHDATKELKSFFRPQYRLYSGAFADVVYDHFLANDIYEIGDEQALDAFATATYRMLDPYVEIFPAPFLKMFPYMKEHNWLFNYRYTWAIEKSLAAVAKRAAYISESKIAFDIFNQNYAAMENCYTAFFPDLKNFTAGKLAELLKR
ncbi:MAG: ACP phosphodiesterase [Ferruginibacter sp.]